MTVVVRACCIYLIGLRKRQQDATTYYNRPIQPRAETTRGRNGFESKLLVTSFQNYTHCSLFIDTLIVFIVFITKAPAPLWARWARAPHFLSQCAPTFHGHVVMAPRNSLRTYNTVILIIL